jgi:hypothetical protein
VGFLSVAAYLVEAGRRIRLSLSYAKADVSVIAPLGKAAETRLEATLAWWRKWVGRCAYESTKSTTSAISQPA